MHYGYLGRKYDRCNKVYTPSRLAEFIHGLIQPTLSPKVVLDPCVGKGLLVRPWWSDAFVLGVDLENHDSLWVDQFIQYPFDLFDTWSFSKPDLVICNPPFNGGERLMMWPERFLRTIVKLFGREQPTAMFVPHGFRLNLRHHSRRRRWMLDGGPKITSIISLPIDTFPGICFHCEVLIFNITGLEPHYWGEAA